jgi:hypothetical protein
MATHYTNAQIIEALQRARGMVYLAADLLKCDPATIYRRLKKSAELRAAHENTLERNLDAAEATLIKQIGEGNTTAVIFYLKTKGKHRGYVERTELRVEITPEHMALLSKYGLSAAQAWQILIDNLAAESQN